MAFGTLSQMICPYCLADIRNSRRPLERCPRADCKQDFPRSYIEKYQQHPPFFVQVFGWTGVGKTVFLAALSLMLRRMANAWPHYTCTAITDPSQGQLQALEEDFWAKGQMPPATQLGRQDTFMLLLERMPLWGGRTLVIRDCAGEIFDTMQIPVDQAPYLLHVPTTFMCISLPDLAHTAGRSMDMLLTNYIETLLRHQVNFTTEQRSLVVVLTKADAISGLPIHFQHYVTTDPLWEAVQTGHRLDDGAMVEYLETMGRMSDALGEWIQRDAAGRNFVRLAASHHITLRYALISSTGRPISVDTPLVASLTQRRVLDPYFWALELQSRPVPAGETHDG